MLAGKIAKGAKKLASSNKFLFGIGMVGVGLTIGTTVVGTLIAKKHIDEKREEIKQEVADQTKISVDKVDEVKLTKVEILQTTWKDYIPTACATALTIVSFSRLFGKMHKENIALQGLLTMSEATVQRLQKKMIDELGEKKGRQKVQEVKQEVIKEQKPELYSGNQKVLKVDEHGNKILNLVDPWSLRPIQTTMVKLTKAMETVNLELHDNGECDVNTFYNALDKDESEVGSIIGWRMNSINGENIEVYVDDRADSFVDATGEAWAILEFNRDPELVLP